MIYLQYDVYILYCCHEIFTFYSSWTAPSTSPCSKLFFFRLSKLLRCLFGGSARCQRSPEVRGSRRLVSFSPTLTVLLGHAAALLQRHQLLHRRDGRQDRLHRPAQEGGLFRTQEVSRTNIKWVGVNSSVFVRVKWNVCSCQTEHQ